MKIVILGKTKIKQSLVITTNFPSLVLINLSKKCHKSSIFSLILIPELRKVGLSWNMIAVTRYMSKSCVGDVIHISDERGIIYDDVKGKTSGAKRGSTPDFLAKPEKRYNCRK